MSEETIVRQAAPTLAGIKTGSMFPYRFESREELPENIRNPYQAIIIHLPVDDYCAFLRKNNVQGGIFL